MPKLAAAAALAAFALLAACYRPALGECEVRCGTGGACPSGLSCDLDEGFCQADRAFDCSMVPDPDGGVPPGDDLYVALSLGESHACAIRDDLSLWCWGRGREGQLGDGLTRDSALPVRAGGDLGDWFTVSAGDHFSCGITGDRDGGGTLYCWGLNNISQVDHSDRGNNVPAPRDVSLGKKWKAVSAGRGEVTCAIDADDKLYCGGANDLGQSGSGASDDIIALTPVDTSASPAGWRAVSAAYSHVCAIDLAGALWCWGGNNQGPGSDGVLGTGDGVDHPLPARVGSDSDWIAITTSANFGCGIRGDASAGGNLFCWGRNSGNLGTTDGGGAQQPTPLRIGAAGDADWKTVDVGFRHTCGVRGQGGKDLLHCFGLGEQGELGLGDRKDVILPKALDPDATWKSADLGLAFGCGLRADGAVLCWGRDDEGQLGDGHASLETAPVRVGTQTGWSFVAGGQTHTCGLRGAELSCWGGNLYGQLGLGAGETQDHATPQPLPGAWKVVAAGYLHTCAINDADQLLCWGINYSGQLGTNDSVGNYTPHSVPKQVAGGVATWLEVEAGGDHTCAIDTGRGLYCWGANYAGQLGQGPVFDGRDEPVRVGSEADWRALACGEAFTCAVHEEAGEAAAYCFGENNHGQLGRGSDRTDSGALMAVTSGVLPWLRLVASGQHICGIESAGGPLGNLRCWGANGVGALGDGSGSLDDSGLPVPPVGAPRALSVSAGRGHTCMVSQTDGTLSCWGFAEYGQLGNGENRVEIYDVPQQVGNETQWSSVFNGYEHACATRTDGSLWCWGRNSFGQLGNGQASTLRPARIADAP